MSPKWDFNDEQVALAKRLIEEQKSTIFVQDRQKRNCADVRPAVTKERLWNAMVCMRLTTQAPSGPSSYVSKFQRLRLGTFPLAYDTVLGTQSDREKFIHSTFKTHKVARHRRTAARQLSDNFAKLEANDWKDILGQCNRLITPGSRAEEEGIAEFMQFQLDGFGPKQSRNLLQALGLTRYEIPVDSRVVTWLNETIVISPSAEKAKLSSKSYYRGIIDGIVLLSERCGVYPCVLDAAVFGAKDPDSWHPKELVF